MENESTPQNHEVTPPVPKKENFFFEILKFTLIALVIVIPIRVFIAQPFIVQGASMEPTFHTGEYLIIDQLSYRFEKPQHGDVIVFRYPKDPSKFFIKRVIGLPGDTVNIAGDVVTITNAEHPEGITLDEPYILTMRPDTVLTEKLGESEYFVMGDNRDASSDSRVWGVLRENFIIGRALVRLLPPQVLSLFPGRYEESTITQN
jgi:signal peptidase I